MLWNNRNVCYGLTIGEAQLENDVCADQDGELVSHFWCQKGPAIPVYITQTK